MTMLHLANHHDGAKLREMWSGVSADEAVHILSSNDVTVTNQADKDMQLPKVMRLNENVKKAYETPSSTELLISRAEQAEARAATAEQRLAILLHGHIPKE